MLLFTPRSLYPHLHRVKCPGCWSCCTSTRALPGPGSTLRGKRPRVGGCCNKKVWWHPVPCHLASLRELQAPPLPCFPPWQPPPCHGQVLPSKLKAFFQIGQYGKCFGLYCKNNRFTKQSPLMLVNSPKGATLSMHKCKKSDYTSFTHIATMGKVWGMVWVLVK